MDIESISLPVLALEWSIRLVVIPVIAFRFRPPAALAWVAVVSAQPFLGLILFMILGENRLPQKRIVEHAQRRRRVQLNLWPMLQPYIVDPECELDNRSRHSLSVQLGEMPAVKGNDLRLISETQEVINSLIEDIRQAQNHVHLLFYIWRDDETGRNVCEALIEAEKRGVHCRVLVDAVGSRHFYRSQARRLREAGVEIHSMLPVSLFRRQFSRIDMRNHRKLVVIDGKIGYTGSQNIVDSDYGTKKLHWFDVMMRVTGPIVLQLQAVFHTDWYAETSKEPDLAESFPPPEISGEKTLQLFPSGPTYHIQNLHRLVLAMLYQARREVMITTPYFIPDDSLLHAFEVARYRGVRVVLVLPEHSDQILVAAAQRAFYQQLLELGVEIYLFQPGLLHSKTLTVDNRFALVGTSNMDIRSFALNLELNLILFDSDSVKTIMEQQMSYYSQSNQLRLSAWRERSRVKTLGEALARLLSPLL